MKGNVLFSNILNRSFILFLHSYAFYKDNTEHMSLSSLRKI